MWQALHHEDSIMRILAFGTTTLGLLVLLAACGKRDEAAKPDESAARASVSPKMAILSAAGIKPSAGEASPEGRLQIGRGKDYVPIEADPAALFTKLESSMQLRRATAWQVVEA